ncbi:MAG: hypothetical protein JXA33_25915, partial [Anaerolineae bacterium]|nr:hypothetical protein [Anaerolineae bacterium]
APFSTWFTPGTCGVPATITVSEPAATGMSYTWNSVAAASPRPTISRKTMWERPIMRSTASPDY